jgi:hypothetical protein
MSGEPRELERIQRWMQAVIAHPDGVAAGLDSPAARAEIDAPARDLESVIRPSKKLSSVERLGVYAGAYYARLLECLREEYPALVHALGEETFDGFAFGYLQSHPPRSYTLADLSAHFPQFLAETRPEDEDLTDWADFLIDLAALERTYAEVFDGPGVEGQPTLQADDLQAIPPERWPEARLLPVPCLRLLTLRAPVHEYVSAVRRGESPAPPGPSPTHLVVTRRDFVVRRAAVSPVEFDLLARLAAGEPVGAAIEQTALAHQADLDHFAAQLQQWFHDWAAGAFFRGVELPR